MIEPVRLLPSDRERAVDALLGAFRDDPLYTYISPDSAERVVGMRALLSAVVQFTLVYGEAWTTPEVSGAACWLPPGRTTISIWQMPRTRFALPRAMLRFSPGALRRATEVFGYADQAHARVVSGPHWYLWALGVEPSAQRRGIAGSLLQPVLNRADAEGLPCYLETETEWNVAFYERRGFAVVEAKRTSGGSDSTLWIRAWRPRRWAGRKRSGCPCPPPTRPRSARRDSRLSPD